jgi:REP element-mobilizing transposase RayT
MPKPGMAWRHVTINTYCSWLKGDPRGFRAKDHEIHSSGDYKNPPPEGEHEGLHDYFKERAAHEVHILYASRKTIGQALLRFFRDQRIPVLALAVAHVHGHALVELIDDPKRIKSIVGEAKRVSSRAVRKELHGKVWSRGCGYKRVRNRGHQQNTHDYIVYDQGPEAWTWSYRDGSDEGQYKRCRPPLR